MAPCSRQDIKFFFNFNLWTYDGESARQEKKNLTCCPSSQALQKLSIYGKKVEKLFV